MPHVLVVGKLHPSGRALLDAAETVTTTFVEEITEEGYAPHVGNADAVLIRTQPMSATTVAKADRLKIVSRHGVGYDAIDVPALSARGIALATCGDVNSTAVTEHAVTMMLSASKRLLRADKATRNGTWSWREKLESRDVGGRNLLLVGYGRIGRHTGAMMKGFGVQVRAYDPFLLQRGWPDDGVTPVESLGDGLAWADLISVSVPHTGSPLLGPSEFAAMREGVVIVNTSRGGVIDEASLVDALGSGKVGAAGLDVFENEPLPADHPLKAFDQVVMSPHIAGLTDGAAERMAISSAQNILDFFAGSIDQSLIVNRDALG